MKCQQFTINKETMKCISCKAKATYKCEACGEYFCGRCARVENFEHECEPLPRILKIKIKKNKK